MALDAAHGVGTAVALRLLAYPLSILIVPVMWWAAGRPRPYPFLADIAVVVPFILDAARIGLELARYPGFDALPHVVGWASLSLAVGLALGPLVRERWIGLGLMIGAGAVIAIGWEVAEFLVVRAGGGFEVTYGNTIADLALSMVGAGLGALGTVRWSWPDPDVPRTLFGWSR